MSEISRSLEHMNDTLAHRGPDSSGLWFEGKIGLGHRRLSIIDLSESGSQPMHSACGRYVMVFNGEIYNYEEVRKSLTNYPFQTDTDSEVLLAAYAQWGASCLDRLNGMFAFAIWDRFEKCFFLSRDRLGIKPLYVYEDDEKLVFSSEVRALMSSGFVSRRINKETLSDYLRYQTVHAPSTIIEGISMFPAGSFLKWKGGQSQKVQYWDLSTTEATNDDLPSAKRKINDLFFDAVSIRLKADVPFGAFLSGGIDSSAIVGVMSRVSDEKVRTFNISFDEREFSEAHYAEIIAKKYGTIHEEIRLNPNDFLEELPHALDAMDHPSGDGINSFVISKAVKKAGITMALTGLGGDELFAGYPVFSRIKKAMDYAWLWKLPSSFRRGFASSLRGIRPGVASEKLYALMRVADFNPSKIYAQARQVIPDEMVSEMLDELSINKSERISSGFSISEGFLYSQISRSEIQTYMQNVLLRDSDQMSMASALELRVPFLDHRLVSYALSLPDTYKRSISPKQLFTDSLGDLLPAEVTNRKKMGFVFPWKDWLKKDLRAFAEENILYLDESGLLSERSAGRLWRAFLAGDPRIVWPAVWQLVVLGYWLRKNLTN